MRVIMSYNMKPNIHSEGNYVIYFCEYTIYKVQYHIDIAANAM